MGAATAFMQGVETMGNLVQGLKEGAGEVKEPQGPGLGEVVKNIADSLGAVRDIARATSGVTGVAMPAEPAIPVGP
jgi:hypothetical protein